MYFQNVGGPNICMGPLLKSLGASAPPAPHRRIAQVNFGGGLTVENFRQR